jgi:N-acetylmuramoyl-L-alanine amidase
LAQYIQNQIVDSLGTLDRGIKAMPQLLVLKYTDMTAVLVEMAFIDNDDDAELLANRQDDFARAIARGVTDYECSL